MKVETQLEVIPFKKLHVHWVLSIFSIGISHVKKKNEGNLPIGKFQVSLWLGARGRSRPYCLVLKVEAQHEEAQQMDVTENGI